MIARDQVRHVSNYLGPAGNYSRGSFPSALLQERLSAWLGNAFTADDSPVRQAAQDVFVAELTKVIDRNFLEVIEYTRHIDEILGDVIIVVYLVAPAQSSSANNKVPSGLVKEVAKQKLGVKPPKPKPPKEPLKIPQPPSRSMRDDLWGDGDDD